jgi:hypothetical protein
VAVLILLGAGSKNMLPSFSIKTFALATFLLVSAVAGGAQSADSLIEKGDLLDSKFQADE